MNRNAAEWLVTDGDRVVGPVSMELIARGIDAGRLTLQMHARHRDSRDWRAIGDIPELVAGEASGVRKAVSDGLAREALAVIESATSRKEAALYLLASAVGRFGCRGGLVHLAGADGSFLTACAHGPNAADVLGANLAADDPTARLAARGERLDGSVDGWWLSTTAQRLAALGVLDVGGLAIGIRANDELLGVIELASAVDFSQRDVKLLELLADAVARAES